MFVFIKRLFQNMLEYFGFGDDRAQVVWNFLKVKGFPDFGKETI